MSDSTYRKRIFVKDIAEPNSQKEKNIRSALNFMAKKTFLKRHPETNGHIPILNKSRVKSKYDLPLLSSLYNLGLRRNNLLQTYHRMTHNSSYNPNEARIKLIANNPRQFQTKSSNHTHKKMVNRDRRRKIARDKRDKNLQKIINVYTKKNNRQNASLNNLLNVYISPNNLFNYNSFSKRNLQKRADINTKNTNVPLNNLFDFNSFSRRNLKR